VRRSTRKKSNVEYIIIDFATDLHKLQSSKYLQSDTRHVYSEIKDLLNAVTIILLSGTPCPNVRLRLCLGSKPDDLFMLDTICHGTPSSKIYRKYLDELALGQVLSKWILDNHYYYQRHLFKTYKR
jgi:hypothetical protein